MNSNTNMMCKLVIIFRHFLILNIVIILYWFIVIYNLTLRSSKKVQSFEYVIFEKAIFLPKTKNL